MPLREMVPEVGLEPTLAEANTALNRARLPIPPLRRGAKRSETPILASLRRGGKGQGVCAGAHAAGPREKTIEIPADFQYHPRFTLDCIMLSVEGRE